MGDPYRDPERACPACRATLREFQGRHVCDACDGMFLALADLANAVKELTGVEPAIAYTREAAGKRACPVCAASMTTCHLELTIDADVVEPKPELDRCAADGIWFDGEELAKVFQKVIGLGPGGGGERKLTKGGYQGGTRWRVHSGVPEWWGQQNSD